MPVVDDEEPEAAKDVVPVAPFAAAAAPFRLAEPLLLETPVLPTLLLAAVLLPSEARLVRPYASRARLDLAAAVAAVAAVVFLGPDAVVDAALVAVLAPAASPPAAVDLRGGGRASRPRFVLAEDPVP